MFISESLPITWLILQKIGGVLNFINSCRISLLNYENPHNPKQIILIKEVISLKSIYTVSLSSIDIFQTIDALGSRAESYEQTARSLTGNNEANEYFLIEECSDHCEAQAIAKHFREIIKKSSIKFIVVTNKQLTPARRTPVSG